MRTILFAVFVLGLGLLAFLGLRSRPEAAAPPLSPPAAQEHAPVPAAEPAGALEQPGPSKPDGRQPAPAPAADSTSVPGAQAGPHAHVFGRIVDETGAGQEGVTVYLTSHETWCAGETIPALAIHGYSMPGFQTRSDAEGRYTFDVPVPSADWVSLWIEAAPYLGLGGRSFGPAGGRNQPRLREGDNDLGELALVITGAVEGDVRSADGARITKARISLDGAFPGGYGVSADADERGHFLLGHVPPGSWTLQAEAEGWLLAQAEGVAVQKRATTPGLSFTLERGPTLAGVVVDERGAALEGIRIWGWPNRSGKGAGARSKQDGSFSIGLPQTDPYTLEVENQGFESWGGHGSDKVYTPGTNGIRIELHRLARTKFLVVDAESGSPIERYAIGAAEVRPEDQGGSGMDARLETKDHAGGVSELDAEPGKQAVFVEAKGYVRLQAAVQPDATGAQTLKLAHGVSISGRVTHAGKAVAHPALRLQRAFYKTDPSQPDASEDDAWFADGYGYDLSAFLGAERRLDGEVDGSFRIGDLASGTWRLEVWGGVAAPHIFKELKLVAQKPMDLGEIALVEGASVRGRVILAAGQSPVGREIRVDDWNHKQTITKADGSFLFEGLGAGKHSLTLEHEQGQGGEVREFELAAGETKEIVLDLSARAPCKVSLRLIRLQKEQPGLKVVAQRLENGQRAQPLALGTSGASGVVEGSLEGGSDYSFEVLSAGELLLARTAPVHLEPGGNYAATIVIEAGELVIVLPDSLVIPEAGQLMVLLRDAQSEDAEPIWAHLSTEKSPFRAGKLVWNSRRVELGSVAAGRYKMQIDAQQLKKLEGTSYMYESLLDVPEAEIAIRSGETTTYTVEQPK
jgi:hypothetical protein